MNIQHRLQLIKEQQRAFINGSIEYIGDEWIFFDDEDDVASNFEDIVQDEFEIWLMDRWLKGSIIESGVVELSKFTYFLQHGDKVRINKKLLLNYSELLQSLNEESFIRFIHCLNQLSFSMYDCIYSHNVLSFFEMNNSNAEGVNFLIFDNLETICNVQHHFFRGSHSTDRFEYTTSSGKRLLSQHI
ncbi:DUF2777 family protein [Bacillus sp. SCS-151]|uniref:DUF2777 family protein n=1 Tax=Nanhaiella sioensis TaxID=3115293 RepID=UPI00397ADA01